MGTESTRPTEGDRRRGGDLGVRQVAAGVVDPHRPTRRHRRDRRRTRGYFRSSASWRSLAAAIWSRRDRSPTADWPLSVAVDTHPTTVIAEPADPPTGRWAPINLPIVEKTALVGLVTVIFLQLVPDVDATMVRDGRCGRRVIVANCCDRRWLVRRGTTWRSTSTQFATMAVVNADIVVAATIVFGAISRRREGSAWAVAVPARLMTLIATLYDRYRGLRIEVPRRPSARRVGSSW